MAIWADVDQLTAAAATFNWWVFPAALGLALMNYLIRFVKWSYYLALLRLEVPWRESLLVFFSSFLLTVTPGKVGEVLKSFLLKRSRGIPISVTAPIVVAERLTDVMALLCLALVGVSAFTFGTTALLISGAMVVAGIGLLSSRRAADAFIRLAGRLPVVGQLAPRLTTAYESIRVMLRPGPLSISTLLSVLAWGCECLAFYWIIAAFPGTTPTLIAATFLYSCTTLLGAISFLPGGLGVTEGSMSVGLLEVGLVSSEAIAVAATVLVRFATLWFAVILGALAFFIYRRGANSKTLAP
jgi:uncharacterized protein (TIRG00374 family)